MKIERESKSCISPSILVSRFSSGLFHLDEAPQTQTKAELHNQFSHAIYFIRCTFGYCSRHIFSISILMISCVH